MSTDQAPPPQTAHSDANGVPAEYTTWRAARWDEIAGPNGKAKVVARGMVVGRDTHVIEGVPGRGAPPRRAPWP